MRPQHNDESGRRLFVGRLSSDTNEVALRSYFSRFGDLSDCVVMRYPDSLRSRGFGFVAFVHQADLERCLSAGPHWLDDKQLHLTRAAAKEGDGGSGRRSDDDPSRRLAHLSSTEVDRRLFIGRLNYATDDVGLRNYFGRWGELEDCIVMLQPGTTKSRGFGFVTFRHAESLEQCLAHTGQHLLDGSEIVLTRARNKDKDEPGRGGGGGYSGKRKWNDAADEDDDEPFDPENKLLRRLFLGRLNLKTTEEELRNYFERFGNLEEVVVMKFADSGRSRGFGFITFERAQSADECQADRPHEIDGKFIECKRATAKKDAKNPEALVEVKKLWVGGFTEDVSDSEVKEYFGQFGGKVLSVEQIRWSDTGKKRGFGFVEFADTDAVDKICLIEKHRLKGRRLEVKKALSKAEMAAARAQQESIHSGEGGWDGGRDGGGRDSGRDGGSSRGSGMSQQDIGGPNPMMMMGGGGGGGNSMFSGIDMQTMQSMFAMFMANMMSGGGGVASGAGDSGAGGGRLGGGGGSMYTSGGGGGSSSRHGGGDSSWGGGYGGSSSSSSSSRYRSGGGSARDSSNPYARTSDASSKRRGW